MQNAFAKIHLPETLALSSLLRNEFLGRAIAKTGGLRLETFYAYLFANLGVSPDGFNGETVAIEVLKLRGMAIEPPGIITNPLWKAIPTKVRVLSSSLEECLCLQEVLGKSQFQKFIQRIDFSPLEAHTVIELIPCEAAGEFLGQLLWFLSQHLGRELTDEAVERKDFRSVFLREHFCQTDQPHAGPVAVRQTRLRLSSFFVGETLDFDKIVGIFDKIKETLKPNPHLLDPETRKMPVIDLNAVPNLAFHLRLTRRKFSSTLHDVDQRPTTPWRKGSFGKWESPLVSRKSTAASPLHPSSEPM